MKVFSFPSMPKYFRLYLNAFLCVLARGDNDATEFLWIVLSLHSYALECCRNIAFLFLWHNFLSQTEFLQISAAYILHVMMVK